MIEQYVLPAGSADYALHARVTATDRLASPTVEGFNVPAAALFDADENLRTVSSLLQGA